MNNKIITKVDNLIDKIKNSDIYMNYIDILKLVSENEEIKELTIEIKKINRALVRTPSIELERILKEKEERINDIPLYVEYKEKLEELNNLLLVIKNKIDKFVEDILVD